MRNSTFLSALVSILFFVIGLGATPTQVRADPPSFSRGNDAGRFSADKSRDDRYRVSRDRDNRARDDRQRVVRDRDNRDRDDRSRDDRYRFDSRDKDYRRDDYNRKVYPFRTWRSEPIHRDYGRPWYRYPRYYSYPRYYHYHYGNDFLGWLAFTAITLAIIDNLSQQQQHEHNLVLHDALSGPVGETIRWNDADASGSVTVLRDGTSSNGRYCREYTQEIRIGDEAQRGYGTACRNADGSWEIVN